MRDVMQMIKQRRSLYLVLLLITASITIYFSFINLNEIAATQFSDNLKSGITQQYLTEYLETGADELTLGIDRGNLLENCFLETYLSEYVAVCLLMIFIMGITFWWMNGTKAMEFAETLPIKRTVKELGQLLPLLAILLINCVVGVVSSVIQLTVKNQQIVALEERFPELLEGRIAQNLVVNANLMFLRQSGTLVLWLVGVFLALYLCSLIMKNRSVGLVFGFIVSVGLPVYIWGLGDLFGYSQLLYELLDFIQYESIVQPITPIMIVIALFCYILLFGLILLQSRYAELSKGRFCYNRIVEFLIVLNVGLISALILFDAIDSIIFYTFIPGKVEIITAKIVSVVWAILVTGVIWYLLSRKKEKIKKADVTVFRTSKNPWLGWRRKTYFIIMAILAIITFIIQNREYTSYRYYFEDYFLYEYVPYEYTLDMLDMLRSLFTPVNWHMHCNILMFVLIFLLVYKVIEMMLFGNRNSTAFIETLPVSRRMRMITNVLKDVALGSAALAAMLVCNLVNLFYFETQYNNGLYALIPGLFAWFCNVIGLIGYLHFIDVIAVNRGMKLFCIPSAFIVMLCSVASWKVAESLYFMIDFPYVFTNMKVSIIYLILGILFLVIAFVLDGKRELSSKIFYFKFAGYGFALFTSFVYASFVWGGMHDGNKILLWTYLILGSVVVFIYTAYCCIPEWKEFISARLIRKHK